MFELVGSSIGEITLWAVASRERLLSKPFKVWDMLSCSIQFQVNISTCSNLSSSVSAYQYVHSFSFSCGFYLEIFFSYVCPLFVNTELLVNYFLELALVIGGRRNV